MTKKDLMSFDDLKDQALGSRPTAAELDQHLARPKRAFQYVSTPAEVDAVMHAMLRSKAEMGTAKDRIEARLGRCMCVPVFVEADFAPIEAKITRAYAQDRLSDRLRRRLLRWKRWWLFQCSICGAPKTRWKAGDRHTHGPYCRRCNKTLSFGAAYGAGPAGLRRMIER